ncbi:MAG: chromosome segregation protein SMC [Streptosporangiaceae bacterium]
MHLKSVTLRGFKSFASSTTLRFEPGITCVVGPNGSGKSNVVDALAWVMGEQGAKSLRGGKMEDVIFAGTSGRPPLGRAAAVLTIDNADGALPIDYSEVTVSRIMFRGGGSEYAINGDSCRLLDVQELLSDSGIGREMHVVVGQGQLDAVLSAGPEERRAFIEEAAGVLKHRKRKEKALRKLDAMQGNLTRLQDLVAELRRQLKPLGRQAEAARKAAVVQAELRDARLRLLADDIVALREELDRERAGETEARERRAAVEASLAQVKSREEALESQAQAELPQLASAQETWYRLSSLRERLRTTASLAAERHRHLTSEPDEGRAGRDPEEMEGEASAIRTREQGLQQDLEEARIHLEETLRRRTDAENAVRDEERRIQAAARAIADRREGLARLRGEVKAARSRLTAGEEEIGRLSEAIAEARERADQAGQEYAELEREITGREADEVGLDQDHERTRAALADAQERVAGLRGEQQEAERERAALAARKEALELSLDRDGDAAETLLAASDRLSGLLGSVAALLGVEPGYEPAVSAALGQAADAVAVKSLDDAAAALDLLKEREAGRVGLVVGEVAQGPEPPCPSLPADACYVLDVVRAPADMGPTVERMLRGVVVVDDLAAARSLVADHPVLKAVTRQGDVLAADWAYGGSSSTPSLLEVQSAVDDATERLEAAGTRCERLGAILAQAVEDEKAAGAAVDRALELLHESDARMTAVAEQLGRLGSSARAGSDESERLTKAVTAAEAASEQDQERLRTLEERLAAAETSGSDADEPAADTRDELSGQASAARSAEMEARLAVRTVEERVRALAGRADTLDRSARAEREARERAAVRRERRVGEAGVARAVSEGARRALDQLETSLERAVAEREEAERTRTAREGELREVRERVRELSGELERLVDATHAGEMARTERRFKLEQLETRAVEEFGVEAEALTVEYGPGVPVPPSPGAGDDAESTPYIRAEQEQRVRAAERELSRLGKVNPLALEEYAALEERHTFLTSQLEDLRATRRDLLTVVSEVDERVEQVFTAAYEDTAREFEHVFATLFPGGEGRLVLTEPDDMLTTGVEVEARPPGKRVKRLSLLSGGERSLTALAVLIAIFKARPSPFYVMDEVEAALDDTNLQRLLAIFEELRESSQLIVVTHQKHTMEVADALYGVSMRGDGVSTVVSQRLREQEPA